MNMMKKCLYYILLFFFLKILFYLFKYRYDIGPRSSYASRYRNVREKYPGETSPTRRTATIVRRVPEAAVVEGKYI